MKAKTIAIALGLISCLASTKALANGPSQQIAQAPTNSITGEINAQSYTLDNGIRINVHTFEGTAGEVLSIEMTSSDFDASLTLVGPDGTTVATNDDRTDMESLDSRIILRLPATGTYQIFAQATNPRSVGQYTLSWRPLTPAEIEQSNLSPGTYRRVEDYGNLPGYSFKDSGITLEGG
ncbi:MAG: PPC domain-containing protein, partial [Cyanobacteria bacterium J06642_11]